MIGGAVFRRFSRAATVLAECLGDIYRYDIAHPGNLDGDNNVILEFLALLAPENGDLSRITLLRLQDILRESLIRSVAERPDEKTLHQAAGLVAAAASTVDWPALEWEGTRLQKDERPLHPRFWPLFDTFEETGAVRNVLTRRFPRAVAILSESLERADPFEIVYPEQGDDYFDVVSEVLMLLAWEKSDLSSLTATYLDSVLHEALARSSGESPDEDRVQHALNLILSKS